MQESLWMSLAFGSRGEIFARGDQVIWPWKSASGGVFEDMLALNLFMIGFLVQLRSHGRLTPESREVSSGVAKCQLRCNKKLTLEL